VGGRLFLFRSGKAKALPGERASVRGRAQRDDFEVVLERLTGMDLCRYPACKRRNLETGERPLSAQGSRPRSIGEENPTKICQSVARLV
jgi:hypothetical protein